MSQGFAFAILTGILFGLQGFAGKAGSNRLPVALLTWATFTGAAPFMIAFFLSSPLPEINWPPTLTATAVSLVVNVVAVNLYYRSLQAGPLYLSMPFTAFSPVFMIPIAYVLLGELPGRKELLGVLLMVGGAYGIYLRPGNLLGPLKAIFTTRATRLMLATAIMWSLSATVEKVAVINSSPFVYGSMVFTAMSLLYLPLVLRRHREYFRRGSGLAKTGLIIGGISGLMAVCQFQALQTVDVSYVIAFKRSGIIVSIFLGYWVYAERNFVRNIAMSAVIVTGAILVM